MYRLIAEAVKKGHSPIIFTGIDEKTIGSISFYDDGVFYGSSLPFDLKILSGLKLPCIYSGFFIDRATACPYLIICGAGHVSVQLVKVADILGFQTIVIDERPDFANKERFPSAYEIVNLPFEKALKELNKPNAYYVIVTRGHQDDLLCLETILSLDFSYCGMIGSHRKVELVLKTLSEKGFPNEILNQIHAPIGIDIGANTPEEIAVSIAAELIQTKNNGLCGTEWSESLVHDILFSDPPYALVTLISKRGSSPRSPGARMIVHPDGRIISSIGGGLGEFEASTYAQDMLKTGDLYRRYTCSMTNEDAAGSGMICGGTVDVLIQIIREK